MGERGISGGQRSLGAGRDLQGSRVGLQDPSLFCCLDSAAERWLRRHVARSLHPGGIFGAKFAHRIEFGQFFDVERHFVRPDAVVELTDRLRADDHARDMRLVQQPGECYASDAHALPLANALDRLDDGVGMIHRDRRKVEGRAAAAIGALFVAPRICR